jgi:hypothetical protein
LQHLRLTCASVCCRRCRWVGPSVPESIYLSLLLLAPLWHPPSGLLRAACVRHQPLASGSPQLVPSPPPPPSQPLPLAACLACCGSQ